MVFTAKGAMDAKGIHFGGAKKPVFFHSVISALSAVNFFLLASFASFAVRAFL